MEFYQGDLRRDITKKIILILILSSALIGCDRTTPIKTGVLKTSGITIKAMDGSYVIKPNKVFKTPHSHKGTFDNACWAGSAIRGDIKYKEALNNNAKKVTINFDNGSPSLFGIMHFCELWIADGIQYIAPDSGYTIQIPNKYIELARQGKISRVYQTVVKTGRFNHYGWILWLSNKPF